MPETQTADLVSVAQAAAELGISPRAVNYRIRRGTLKATKLGPGTAGYVIQRADLDAAKADKQTA